MTSPVVGSTWMAKVLLPFVLQKRSRSRASSSASASVNVIVTFSAGSLPEYLKGPAEPLEGAL
jgi:hypothetical protein